MDIPEVIKKIIIEKAEKLKEDEKTYRIPISVVRRRLQGNYGIETARDLAKILDISEKELAIKIKNRICDSTPTILDELDDKEIETTLQSTDTIMKEVEESITTNFNQTKVDLLKLESTLIKLYRVLEDASKIISWGRAQRKQLDSVSKEN